MCAICGIIKNEGKVEEKLLFEMTCLMNYRGPDEEGYFIEENVGLGHKRLSIIDLKTGKQPLFNEDKKIVLICNGEIYNFKELRENLEKKGHKFRTNSDNEVIVHLYEDRQEKCIDYLRGMFAFAIWDSNEKQLFLVRDRLGQKPLIYSLVGKDIVFSSEIKSILLYPEIKKEINLEALSDYLTYQAIPSPNTIFKDIKKIPPACYLIWKNGNIKIEKYWDIDFTKKNYFKNENDYMELLWENLKEATKLRLISDVPLGAFLSGGIDSSTIVGIMSEICEIPVKTFSVGFDVKEYSELEYAKIVAKKFGTQHHEFIIQPDIIKCLPKLVWHYNEPFADSSMIPTYYLAKETSNYVKVALNGDGGDENFAGYDRYYQTMVLSKLYSFCKKAGLTSSYVKNLIEKIYQKFPAPFPVRILEWIKEADDFGFGFAYSRRLQSFSDIWKEKIYSPWFKNELKNYNSIEIVDKLWEKNKADNLLEKMLYTDFHLYLPEVLMVKIDIATMANSLEGRSPFLDYKFIETISSFPPELKLKGKISKYILKKKLKGFLPDEILKRGKMGFGVPVGEWFKGELANYLKSIILNKRFFKRNFFEKKYVEEIVQQHISGRVNHSSRLWTLLCFEIWCRIFLDGEQV